MQVIISARGLTVSKTYKDAVTAKLTKLEPILPKIVEMKVVLSKEKHRRTAALTVVAKKHTGRRGRTAPGQRRRVPALHQRDDRLGERHLPSPRGRIRADRVPVMGPHRQVRG